MKVSHLNKKQYRALSVMLTLLITIIAVVGIFQLNAKAATIIDVGDYVYQVLEDGKNVKIIQYKGESLYVKLPTTVEEYTVSAVGPAAFMSNRTIKELDISNTITAIESNAFADCTALQKLLVPGSVETIDACAFMNCTALTSVTLLDGVNNLGRSVFAGCTSLSDVKLPNSIEFIDDYAFFNCSALDSITIPATLRDFGGYVLEGTGWMKKQKSDFVTVGNGILIKYSGKEKSRSVPDNVKIIGEYAFAENHELDTILMSKSVVKISAHAFKNCTSLKKVGMQNSVLEIGDAAFYGCTSMEKITLPSFIPKMSQSVFEKCTSLKSIQIPASVAVVGINAFKDCTELTEVKLQNGLQEIHIYAFSGCIGLRRLVVPETVKIIETMACEKCINLTRVEFNGDTKVSSLTFSDCINLSEVVFYKNPTDIDDLAFYGIKDITFYSDNSLYVSNYSSKHRYVSDNIRNLPPYRDKGIISTEIPQEESTFSAGYVVILIVIIFIDLGVIALFSFYLLVLRPRIARKKAQAAAARRAKRASLSEEHHSADSAADHGKSTNTNKQSYSDHRSSVMSSDDRSSSAKKPAPSHGSRYGRYSSDREKNSSAPSSEDPRRNSAYGPANRTIRRPVPTEDNRSANRKPYKPEE